MRSRSKFLRGASATLIVLWMPLLVLGVPFFIGGLPHNKGDGPPKCDGQVMTRDMMCFGGYHGAATYDDMAQYKKNDQKGQPVFMDLGAVMSVLGFTGLGLLLREKLAARRRRRSDTEAISAALFGPR